MIFGEIVHEEHYEDVFPALLGVISATFAHVDSGVQGDAWIWIFENDEKVSLDTFSSMQFQLKAKQEGGILLGKVISVLERKYKLCIYTTPEA